MADVPAGVGWLTVTLFADEALADSSDVGDPPDRVGLNGTVTLTLQGLPASRPYLVDISSGDPASYRLLSTRPIVCPVVDGIIEAPDNGSEGVASAENGVRIIPTISTGLDVAGCWWRASWTPQTQIRNGPPVVPPFTIPFTGRDGDVVNLAAAALTPPAVASAGTVLTPVWISSDGTVPTGAQAGQLLYDESSGELSVIDSL